ncbi:MAG: helix-turn-helix domain-containing protein, partial [Betaproteobacteria bacterium]
IYLADERFVRRAQTKVRLSGGSREIPRAQRRRTALPLERYLERQGGRDEGIARAYCEGGYTQSAIAQVLGLSVSRISRVIRTVEAKGKT